MATFSNMISVFFLIFIVGIASSHQDGPDGQLTDAINQFSTQLNWAASQNNNNGGNNLFVGGMSAHIILTLLSCGATGNTLNELNNGLHLQDDTVKAAYHQAIQNMNSYQQVKFQWSDKVYIQNGQKLNSNFQSNANQIFGAEVENIDFSNGDQAANQINNWVGEKTHNTTNNLVNGGDFANTITALVNAMYFQGAWDKPFDPKNTKKQDFHVNGATKQVETMHQQYDTKYGENAALDAKILGMAFNGNEMSVIVILPNKQDGLNDLEKKLTNTKIEDVVKNLTQQTVDVYLPKFGVENANVFNDVLCKLGICSMFKPNAELNGILDNFNAQLHVTNVHHNIYLNFHEGGVTAGAGTGVVVSQTFTNHSKRSSPQQFKADHPYFFAGINKDNQMVFSGHFTGSNN